MSTLPPAQDEGFDGSPGDDSSEKSNAVHPHRPLRVSGLITLLCTVALILTHGIVGLPRLFPDPDGARKQSPPGRKVENLDAIQGRALDTEEYALSRPLPERLLLGWYGPKAKREALWAYNALPYRFHDDITWRTRVILVAETDRPEALIQELSLLQREPDYREFAHTVRYAYLGKGVPPTQKELDTALDRLWPEWASDTLQRRVAARNREESTASLAQIRIQNRGRRLYDRYAPFAVLKLGLIAAAVVLIVSRRARQMAWRPMQSGVRIAPWRGRTGYAALVRVQVMGLAVGLAVGLASSRAELPPVVDGLVNVALAILPLGLCVWLLLRPHRLTIKAVFPVRVDRNDLPAVLTLATCLLGLSFFGSRLIGAGRFLTGLQFPADYSDYANLTQESLAAVGLAVFWGVVCAPVVEEIVYRGFVYATLRRRFRPFSAALFSGVLFAFAHYYPLPGTLTLAWSGFLLALAYERCGSLVPGILYHAAVNTLVYLPILIVHYE